MKQLMSRFLKKYKDHGIFIYYVVMFTAGSINFVRNIVYAKVLGPVELGYYSFAILLSIFFLSFCSFGLYEGSLGLFPVMYGQGKVHETEVLRNRTSGTILMLSGLLIFLSLVFSITYPFRNPQHQNMLIACAIFAASQQYLSFLMVDMRSRMMTMQFGWLMLWRSGLSLIAGTAAAIYSGFIGILFCETVISIILIFFVIRYCMDNYHVSFDGLFSLKPIVHIGIPLMINNLIVNIASNLEKFFIISIFGTFLFGQYSFAMLIVTGAALFQGIVYQHLGPSILYKIGNGGNVADLLKRIDKLVMIGGAGLLLFWYPFSEIARFIVRNYFQGYEYTVKLFPIIYIGAGFMILSQYEHFIIAYRKTRNIMFANIAVILLLCIFLFTIYLLKLPVLYFAVSFVIGRGVYFLITYWLAKFEIKTRMRLTVTEVIEMGSDTSRQSAKINVIN